MNVDEELIQARIAIEVCRVTILRLGGFTCVHDTPINPNTLQHSGSCSGCPIIDVETLATKTNGIICDRERWFSESVKDRISSIIAEDSEVFRRAVQEGRLNSGLG